MMIRVCLYLALASAFVVKAAEVGEPKTPPVDIFLYYESLCPGCQEILRGPVWAIFNMLKGQNMTNIRLIPFGNAVETKKKGKWTFRCQHGAEECFGNLLEGCIIHQSGYDVNKYMNVIHCMEDNDDPIKAAKSCVHKFGQHLKFNQVIKCAKGMEGNHIMHKFAQETMNLKPRHTYVPWLVIDGDASEKTQDAAWKNILGVVCDKYKANPKPRPCWTKAGENVGKSLLDFFRRAL